MANHTPGEWVASKVEGGSWLIRTDVRLDGSVVPVPIAVAPLEADARLISASPKLLEALRQVQGLVVEAMDLERISAAAALEQTDVIVTAAIAHTVVVSA